MTGLLIIALVTLVPAAVAMALRNVIHSALLLIASWAGIAAFYFWAAAEFVAFGQVLVYVGAVSMIVLFAVLLTRHTRTETGMAPDTLGRALAGLLTGGAVLGVLFGAVLSTPLPVGSQPAAAVSVHTLGVQLMERHTIALLVVGLLLTVALLGAVVLAASDSRSEDRR
jgi:NADH:ubiquinone oxidoreductase subunit 6 (subunit J)